MNRKIQVLRGLAITAVVIIHSYPHGTAGIFIRAAVNFAVAMFLFCSGYLTKTAYPDIGRFYKKRLTRVLIPYSIWSLIYTVAYAVKDHALNNLVLKYFYSLIYGTANFSLYFVVVYVLFTLAAPLIGLLAQSKFRWIGWLITPVYMILTIYIPCWTGQGILPSAIQPFLRLQWFHFYYLGMVLGNHLIQYERSRKQTVMIYLVTLLISLCEGFYWNGLGNYSMATTQARLSCVFSSSFACLIAFQYLENAYETGERKWENWLAWLGDYSFGIYLMHVLVIGLLGVIPAYSYVPFPGTTLLILLITVCGLVLTDKVFKGKMNRILGIK